MTNLDVCEHGRHETSCEDCRFIAAWERKQPATRALAGESKPKRAPRNVTRSADPVVVEQDTHVERPDIATEDFEPVTFVRAGDEVPAELVDLPRHSVGKDNTGKDASASKATAGPGKRTS